jgi:hypothetical protein
MPLRFDRSITHGDESPMCPACISPSGISDIWEMKEGSQAECGTCGAVLEISDVEIQRTLWWTVAETPSREAGDSLGHPEDPWSGDRPNPGSNDDWGDDYGDR